MIARSCLLMVLVLLLAPRPALALSGTTALTVQLLTTEERGQPVAQARVTILEAASGQQLAEATTDAEGQADLGAVPSTEVRVVVAGRHPSGAALRLSGQDSDGIWVRLAAAAWTMALRADSDGAVFPDLASTSAGAPDADAATAIAGGTLPTVAVPTALLVHRAPTPVLAVMPTMAAPVAEAASPPPGEPPSVWRMALLAVLMLCVAGIVLLGGKA